MTSRGIRNNNPGNIRKGNNWNGEMLNENKTAAQAAETAFEIFSCPAYGIRALAKLLLNYQQRYNLDTIRKIISRYAPEEENDTSSYAGYITAKTRFGIDEVIDLREPEKMGIFLEAIITFENGQQPYTYEIQDGMTLAGLGEA